MAVARGASPGGHGSVDGRALLALSVHAAPGAYAVLVGSGMSSAAGLPTGWQVMQDLARRVATAERVSPDVVGSDPLAWWTERTGRDPTYSSLLSAVAPTDAARQALLLSYFDPGPGTVPTGAPTAAHRVLGELVSAGRVRVLLTTNFDKLVERGLDAAGVSPQVVHRAEAIRGMVPLVHAPATVVKLHGDYTSLGQRNTTEELDVYPTAMRRLLSRVFDEYGLVVLGWSAEWDTALVRELENASSRRYPTYWAVHRGTLGETAARLVALRRATVIDSTGADEVLEDLAVRLRRLDATSARRVRHQVRRNYGLAPDTTAPYGWSTLPLLVLRVGAFVGPAALDDIGLIGPTQRTALVGALDTAALTNRARSLANKSTPASPHATAVSALSYPLDGWRPPVGVRQSSDMALYGLGGDGGGGVSVRFNLRLPSPTTGGAVVFLIDIGVSCVERLAVEDAALLLRDAVLAVTGDLPAAVEGLLPADAEPRLVELHLVAPNTDGNNHNRPNSLLARLDLSAAKDATAPPGPSLGCAVAVPVPLGLNDANAVVADAVEYILLAAGYLDPGPAVDAVRSALDESPPRRADGAGP